MTDPAEDVIARLNRGLTLWSTTPMMCDVIELAIATVASQAADIEWLTAKRDELRALIASQAAEIELLKRVAREVALQHHNWNQHNASLIGEQAAEIERMRAHIQAGRELVPRFQFLFPTSGSKESVGTMVDVLAHMRAQAFLGSAPASGH